MGFINPKERVIEFRLTQKGRELLAKGKLHVRYFSLFDDEVDYKNTEISTVDEASAPPPPTSSVVAPTITVPPVLTWTVEIGNSPTITPPVYTGDPGTITYTLYRDGVADTTIVNVNLATAEAYVAQWSGDTTGINDIGGETDVVQLTFVATVTNSAGSDSAESNAVSFDHASYLPDTAIWANPVTNNGITTVGSDGDSWASGWGGVACTLEAPAATHRPAYATDGVGGRPTLTFDGVDDFLRGDFTKGSAFVDQEIGVVGERLSFGTVGDIWFGYWRANSPRFYFRDLNANQWRFTDAVNVDVPSTYDPGVLAHYSGDGALPDTISARVAGAVVASATATPVSVEDGRTVIMGASQVSATGPYGTVAANVRLHAAHIGPALSAAQRLHLRALLTGLTGVAC